LYKNYLFFLLGLVISISTFRLCLDLGNDLWGWEEMDLWGWLRLFGLRDDKVNLWEWFIEIVSDMIVAKKFIIFF